MTDNTIIKISPLGFPWETLDPFIFCVHHRDEYPKGNEHMGPATSLAGRNIGQDFTIRDGWRMYHGSQVPGFPYHPHRGFETITVVKDGWVDHTDSLGAAGRFTDGDVQWMTAGKGVQHSEMFPLLNTDSENPFEIFQIWLNLPKKSKFVEPHFKMLWKESIPIFTHKDANNKKIEINVIAGEIDQVVPPSPTPDSWASEPKNEVCVWTLKMDAGSVWTIPPAAVGLNRTIYFYKGDSLMVNKTGVAPNHLAQLKSDVEVQLLAGNEDCFLLLLQGRPINEPVVQYGPFVMNTEEEIKEAYADFRKTQFGGWPWPEQEQTHERSKGRFALHADGRKETPE